MERHQIEHYYSSGQYQEALDDLTKVKPSSWSDTTKLRCMRAMGHKDAVSYADQLRTAIAESSGSYSMNTSERNNQLRYIALIYSERNRAKDACDILAELCKQSPDVPALHREYAFALTNDAQLELAESELKNAIKLQPNNAKSHAQLGRIYCRTGRTNAGYSCYSRAATLEPNNANYVQRLLYWSNYSEHTSQQSIFQLTQLWASKAFPNKLIDANTWKTDNSGRQLKLGFVSPNFYAHSIYCFIFPLLEGLSRVEFHVTAYSDAKKVDHQMGKIKALCDAWQDSSHTNDAQLAAQIKDDKIDVLVDLSGHSTGNRLGVFAKRCAPIQLSWLGYPSTTGLQGIDYRITDRIADPLGPDDQFYSEALLRLPNGFLCYTAPEDAPEIKPSGDQSHIRFGAFNSLAKVSNRTLDCWTAALLAVPRSTLTIKHHQLNNKNAVNYFLKQLGDRGISLDRITLKTSNSKVKRHLNEYNDIDIALDTTPYNSTTATLDALWMGVPVISLTGKTHASRMTASILHRLNLSGLATKTVLEFAERAKELSELDETLQELRFGLRKRMQASALMNSRQFAREFGNTLRSQWRDWCDENAAEPSSKKTQTTHAAGAEE